MAKIDKSISLIVNTKSTNACFSIFFNRPGFVEIIFIKQNDHLVAEVYDQKGELLGCYDTAVVNKGWKA